MAMILVADDEPDVAALFADVLTSAGHTVHTAPDGPTALERIADLRPDLSVLDHYMPEMTGLQVAQQLRADPATSSLPLLMVSASAPPTALLYCNVVLAKPVPLAHFRMVVQDLLRQEPNETLHDLDRVRAVARLLDLHTDRIAGRLNELAEQVATEAGAAMAAVNMVLIDAVAVCGAYGLGGWIEQAGGIPAEWAPCTRVVREGEGILIDDLGEDQAFAGTPLATVTKVRSYAGVPLRDAAGHIVGAVNVMDRTPAAFDKDTLNRLLARTASVQEIVQS
ncbi:response regulator [Paractinoplanes atraurantiacus]|uniref:GAF domain-containing protein n=1 Tax=Paractinoplanes atraurantiacus TaxID=1036182 RepID=A0A285EY83_9ACTN|nr:response regulator [Actinoplanes atraurantiacus]SNY03753.1 GAF domain-containing protein [Actinoplanes atraurantiacus]